MHLTAILLWSFPLYITVKMLVFISCTNLHLITLCKTVVLQVLRLCAVSALTVEAICFKWVME